MLSLTQDRGVVWVCGEWSHVVSTEGEEQASETATKTPLGILHLPLGRGAAVPAQLPVSVQGCRDGRAFGKPLGRGLGLGS